MELPLLQDEAVPNLWTAYKKTKEYKAGFNKAIPEHHELVERREVEGLRSIYKRFVKTLEANQDVREELKNRTVGQWLNEWREMHVLLFGKVLRECGEFRKKDVRFGSPGDDWGIPDYISVTRQASELAHQISDNLEVGYESDWDKYLVLAKIHFEFVRIHPFVDGNGRIARAVVDQIAICFGYPPAIGGYPRNTFER
jgi:cell filamentation protein, protein adenylyltransferase